MDSLGFSHYRVKNTRFKTYNLVTSNCAIVVYEAFYSVMPKKIDSIIRYAPNIYSTLFLPTTVFFLLKAVKNRYY